MPSPSHHPPPLYCKIYQRHFVNQVSSIISPVFSSRSVLVFPEKMNKIVVTSVVRLNYNKLYQNHRRLNAFLPSSVRLLSDNSGSDDGKSGKEKLDLLLQSMKMSGGSDFKTEVDKKLARPNFINPIKRNKEGKPESHLPPTDELDDEMVGVTKDVARLSSNSKQRNRAESELLVRLKQLNKDTVEAKRENEISGEEMNSILSDMKVDKPLSKGKQKNFDRSEKTDLSMEQAAFLQKRAKLRRLKGSKDELKSTIDLKSGIPMEIFTGPMEESKQEAETIKTWKACRDRELDILSRPPPRNALDEMILQTKQGKLWHFPINNEQGQH